MALFYVTSPVFHDSCHEILDSQMCLGGEDPHPVLDPLSQILGEIRRPVLKKQTGDSG